MGRKVSNLVGEVVSGWAVISYQGIGANRSALWSAACNECGREVTRDASTLKRCPCNCTKVKYRVPWDSNLRSSHRSAKARCTDPKHKNYVYYKDVEFSLTVESIYNAIGNPPTSNHTLDRIDGNRGYVVDNIRWATPKEQQRNRKDNNWYEYQGKQYIAKDLYDLIQPPVRYDTFRARLRKGYSIDKATQGLLNTNGQPL